MKRFSLIAKLYLVLAPLCITGVVVGFVTRASLRDNAKALVEARQVKELAVKSLALLLIQDDASKTMLLDPDNPRAGLRKIKAYDANQAVFEEIGKLSRSAALRIILTNLKNVDESELRPLDTQILEELADGKLSKAKELYFGSYEKVRDRYEELVRKLGNEAESIALTAARSVTEKNEASFRNICLTMMAGILTVALAIVLFGRYISRRLNTTAGHLRAEAEKTAESSQELQKASERLSSAAAETAVSIGTTTESLSLLTDKTRANEQSAHTARSLAALALDAAEAGVDKMRDLESSMKAAEMASEGISRVIATIEQIAFQTKILALNAAIEAARGGEAGLGFAVVAEEVRSLAQRSSQGAQDSIILIEDAVRKTREGTRIGLDVAGTLEAISARAREVSRVVSEISSGCAEQRQGIEQIGAAIRQVEAVTSVSAGQARGSAEAANDLAGQSEVLQSAVSELFALVSARQERES